MRVFLDTNVVLDFLTGREPFVDDAEEVIELCTHDGICGVFTTLSACNAIYILAKVIGRREAEARLRQFVDLVGLVGVRPESITDNLLGSHSDFEDAVQLSEAATWQADAIVTRDKRGFADSEIPVYTPSEFLEKMA